MKTKNSERAQRILREARQQRQITIIQENKWQTTAKHHPDILWEAHDKIMRELR